VCKRTVKIKTVQVAMRMTQPEMPMSKPTLGIMDPFDPDRDN